MMFPIQFRGRTRCSERKELLGQNQLSAFDGSNQLQGLGF